MRPAFPDALFGGVYWDRLLARAAEAPAEAIREEFGFEIRAGRSERAADFCVAIPPGSELASRYIGLAHMEALAACLEEIAGAGSFAALGIANGVTMLEYDVVETPPGSRPSPGVFWTMAEDAGPPQVARVAPLLAIASGLNGWAAPLRRVADAAAPYGRVSQLGTFAGRKRADLRVIVSGVEREAAAPLLDAVGWPGSVSAAAEAVAACALPGMRLSVALDIGPGGTGPRLGLELLVPGGWPRSRYRQWRPLIDILTAKGLCRADKALGLKRWCGVTRLFGRRMFFLAKGINHVKIGIRDDTVEAKVYLGACRRSAEEMGLH